jgi:hypothetical protein
MDLPSCKYEKVLQVERTVMAAKVEFRHGASSLDFDGCHACLAQRGNSGKC